MNTKQIMAAVERYRTAGGREEHHAYKDQLEAAIEALVHERDAWEIASNDLLAVCNKTKEQNKTLRDALETIAETTDGTDCNEVARAALKGETK